jgi:hypothetical protein
MALTGLSLFALRYGLTIDKGLLFALLAFLLYQQVLSFTESLGGLFITLAIVSRMDVITKLQSSISNRFQEQ